MEADCCSVIERPVPENDACYVFRDLSLVLVFTSAIFAVQYIAGGV
jgi:hypothetical protein